MKAPDEPNTATVPPAPHVFEAFWSSVEHGLLTVAAEDVTRMGPLIERTGAFFHQLAGELPTLDTWLYLRVATPPATGLLDVARCVATLLTEAEERGHIHSWWWLNKADVIGRAVRVRAFLGAADVASTTRELSDRLEASGLASTVLCYEPELCLFGGAAGMQIAHDYFCADSHFLAGWMQPDDPAAPPILPDGLSLALALWMLRVAGLDLFESWDVFCRVLDKRKPPIGPEHARTRFHTVARHVLSRGPAAVFALYDGRRAVVLNAYVAALERIGSRLNRAYYEGHLRCGLREFLAAVVLFHWNRAALSTGRQGALAAAGANELECICRRRGTTA